MFCVNCGKDITDAKRFCPYCGAVCTHTVRKRSFFRKRWRVAAAILLTFCVLGVLLAGVGRLVSRYRYQRQLSLGDRYLQEMEYEEAAAAYERAIRIDPKQEDAYLKAAQARLEMGEGEEAVSLVETALEAVGKEKFDSLQEEVEKIRKEAAAQEAEQTVQGTGEGENVENPGRAELDAKSVYDLYSRLNPLLAWSDDYYGEKDVLGEIEKTGNRKEFANICFAYLEQLCPDAQIEDYVEHYTSYNTVFGDGAFSAKEEGTIEEMGTPYETIDRARAQEEFKKDWCRNLDLSGEEYTYEVVGHSGWRLTNAYKLEEVNKALKAFLGERFIEFTAEELEGYNFLYDPENQIICRKAREGIYFEAATASEFVHNYVQEAFRDGEKTYIRIKHLRLSLNEEGVWSSETEQWCSSYEEALQYQGDGSWRWVLANTWGKHGQACSVPLFYYGRPIPLLYAQNLDSGSSAANEDYDLGVCGFIDAQNRELDWEYAPSRGDGKIVRYLSEEEAFACAQANAKELMDPENEFHSSLQTEYEIIFVLENEEGIYRVAEILR